MLIWGYKKENDGLTAITGSHFTENLYYETNPANLPDFSNAYNGNIAGMQWSLPTENLGYNRAYTFGYDGLNRLTDGIYCGMNGTSAAAGTTGLYNETMDYDKEGNFADLNRWDKAGKLNQLTFINCGNQLKAIADGLSVALPYGSEAFSDKVKATTEYTYDSNGNMTYDGNTGISTIRYNVLNLPDTIQFAAGHQNYYSYDAGGKKLEVENITSRNILNLPQDTITRLTSSTTLTTDYCGDAIYQNSSLKEILTPTGYWQNGVYYYYLKDHQGNNREVLSQTKQVVEYSDYYPDGMRFEASTSDTSALPYRYNGKELEAMNGLNQYDYGARRRETGIPVWTTMDPLCEKYYGVSPYTYCSDNPINRIDPDGKKDYTLSLDLRLGTGEIGFKGKILGIPIGFDLSLGSASQSYKLYISYDSDKKKVKGGVSYIQTETEAGSGSLALGVEGGESKERSKIYDINTKEGASKNIEATFQTKESEGVDKIKTENGNLNIDISSLDVRALLLSIGAKINLQVTPTQSTRKIEVKPEIKNNTK